MNKLPNNQKWFRQVMSEYPTGVCVVTATHNDKPCGMVVGSFTSVSLDPPLVAFMPGKDSTTWPKIEAAKHFCVNIFGIDQLELCGKLASKSQNKFDNLSIRTSKCGAVIIEGCVAWVDCIRHAVHDAGDHYIVLGEIIAMDRISGQSPLLFCKSSYGSFKPMTG